MPLRPPEMQSIEKPLAARIVFNSDSVAAELMVGSVSRSSTPPLPPKANNWLSELVRAGKDSCPPVVGVQLLKSKSDPQTGNCVSNVARPAFSAVRICSAVD